VQLAATDLGGDATYAVIERSLNEVLWFPVRGGLTVPVVDEEFDAGTIDDFEFFADVENHYRVTSFDADDVQQEQFTDDITPSLAGVVWLKSIKHPNLSRPVHVIDRGETIGRASRSVAHPIVGRSTPVASGDLRHSRDFELSIMTTSEHHQTAGELDIVLAAGGVWLVHVPAASSVPGGYVVIGDTVEERLFRGDPDAPRVFTLPCTVVTPPAPAVVGSLLTAQTLFRLFGNADALYAAHSFGRSLVATIGSVEDTVVV
jgi:hypothetical protein